jgi:predicted NUDIX family NTP pyrophosphohydrolase
MQSVWNKHCGGTSTQFMFLHHMAFEEMKQETMHVVSNFSFSSIGMVSDIVGNVFDMDVHDVSGVFREF